MTELQDMKCGLVALVGVPNAGKSTLLNALVGEKVGIVSPKPNTTRVTVRGVLTQGDTQLVLMDTPGMNRSKKAFDRRLVQQASGALNEADVVVILCALGARGSWEQEKEWAKQAKERGQQVLVALTKIDSIKDKKALLPLLADLNEWGVDGVIPMAALKKDGLDVLVKELVKRVPAGPWLFPAGQVTDMPVKLRLAEITREKAMRLLEQEIPYGVGVVTEMITESDDEPWLVQQRLLIAREQHKPIVIGKGGQMLKEIGTLARKEMQMILGHGVRLELHVKVAERWAEREEWLREMGI